MAPVFTGGIQHAEIISVPDRMVGLSKSLHVHSMQLSCSLQVIVINNNNTKKFITRTCSQALSLNRRHGQSLGG